MPEASRVEILKPDLTVPENWWLYNRWEDHSEGTVRKLDRFYDVLDSVSNYGGLIYAINRSNGVVAAGENRRKQMAEKANSLLQSLTDIRSLEMMPKEFVSQLLLFANWQTLSAPLQQNLVKLYGEPLHDTLEVVPAAAVQQWGITEQCGEMEKKMLESQDHWGLGSSRRLLLKFYGTDAAITDRLLVTAHGNVLLPYIWYIPDALYLARANKSLKAKALNEQGSFSTVGLQVMRPSPKAKGEEGWDVEKHEKEGLFMNLHNGSLTKLIDAQSQ